MKLVCILIFLLCFVGISEAKPVLLNGTAAVVEKTLISVQDAYIYRALQRFKSAENPAVLIEDGEDLKKTVQKLVFEQMVYTELKAMKVENNFKPTQSSWLAVEKNKGRSKVWRDLLSHFGLSETQAVERMNRSQQVEEFLQRKAETMTPIITEDEAQKYFKQNEAKFRGSSFETLKPSIVILLKKQILQRGLEEWVRFLKEKYAVVSLLEAP